MPPVAGFIHLHLLIILIGFPCMNHSHWNSYVVHFRGWLGYAFALMLLFFAIFVVLTQFCNQGRPADEIKIIAPPPMNTMEQLLAVQNAISQAEQLIQDGNIVLLKFRALLLSIFPQVVLF